LFTFVTGRIYLDDYREVCHPRGLH
jgi:hypothetical protein